MDKPYDLEEERTSLHATLTSLQGRYWRPSSPLNHSGEQP